MNKILYKAFHDELENYSVPLILKNCDFIRLYDYDLFRRKIELIGFCNIYGDYVDAFYILPEYRKQGLGSKHIKGIYKDFNFKKLHIINTNKPALNFWKKNFKLKKIETNFCDTLYEIKGVK